MSGEDIGRIGEEILDRDETSVADALQPLIGQLPLFRERHGVARSEDLLLEEIFEPVASLVVVVVEQARQDGRVQTPAALNLRAE